MAKKKQASRSKQKRKVIATKGMVFITSSFNNTIITITDMEGNAILWSSPGRVGFKGTKKSTPFAAQRAARGLADEVLKLGLREVLIKVKGPGSGREAAVRAFKASDLNVVGVHDISPRPHNGCRLKKKKKG